jgi:hypothetical protein
MDIGLLLMTAAQAAAADDDGLTWREVLADLPHDTTSIVILGFLAASVFLVIWASKPRKSPRGRAGDDS